MIGDAAAVFVLSIDRAAFAADPLGPARGYRHAFLEAGRVGERVYLEAAARGSAPARSARSTTTRPPRSSASIPRASGWFTSRRSASA